MDWKLDGGPFNTFFFFQDPDGNNWAVQQK